MNIGHFNELRRYNQARQAERRDAIVAKAALVIFLLILAGVV